ncbi:helix-turn-helix domain-containing protein [Paraburkholderia sp. Tr-20389]|uniref:helix-turn-helix domain-containing protein n=1 Tax=Paraburkholderia sp. Tr-20389 TaxID=2703903 RepID=UPI00197F0776|nr:helix-turn-helix domain-containing protein [Paraburkholderia sp. Tr-20389]MBN3756101.1 helix-turn-helix domain-containing protein [Paraburkholderia sp. Tr-20389]
MSYGLDLSEVRYETDHAGNRLKATIPYTMFSALTEFWVAARRAQTARVEARSRPGQFKGSLQAAQLPTPDEPAAASPPPESLRPRNPHDRHWQTLINSLPVVDDPPEPEARLAVTSPPEEVFLAQASPARASPEVIKSPKERVFYREFVEAPPVEVAERIAVGVYFTRAWREYRNLTLADAADLFGRGKATIMWHESGKSAPKPVTLGKLAQIYDCPVAQMMPLPGSDTSPFTGEARKGESVVEAKAEKVPRTITEPRSPANTDYPEGVLEHLIAGKSPLLAWRLYRGMSVKALAEAYGTTTSNLTAMERNAWLRRSTIDKLCPIFHCYPAQLLRPDRMASLHDVVQHAAEDRLQSTQAELARH